MIRLLGASSALAFTLFACSSALAAEVTQTIGSSASPTKVWALIGKFEDIVDWLPSVTSSPSTKDSTVGAIRTITLKAPGSPKVVEKLTAHNNHLHSYSYEIIKVNPKVLPVTAYTSTISVTKSGSGSTITWHGTFRPAPGADDAAAEQAVGGLYKSGLNNVKLLMEK